MIRNPEYSYQLAWSEEDGGYIATCPELPTLSAYGASATQAIAELQEAVNGALEILAEQGAAIPAARLLPRHSGQFRVRLPKSLHAQLAARAEAEGVSLNTLVVSFLSQALASDAASSKVPQRRQSRAPIKHALSRPVRP